MEQSKSLNVCYNYEWAKRFFDFCLSDEGQNIIGTFGTK
jgi:ABC-type tungstate transport system permease subunit